MDSWKEVNDSFDRINNKLDLILELVNAQKAEDWKRVGEVCEKLDNLKKVPLMG